MFIRLFEPVIEGFIFDISWSNLGGIRMEDEIAVEAVVLEWVDQCI